MSIECEEVPAGWSRGLQDEVDEGGGVRVVGGGVRVTEVQGQGVRGAWLVKRVLVQEEEAITGEGERRSCGEGGAQEGGEEV